MAAINNDWAEALKEEYKKPYYRELYKKINQESITSGLLWDNLELDGMYVVPLKNKQY